tara:strand:- start:357 stop:1280 length:924 start_codon:yes stop_codon:yes gene_type:complete
MGNINVAVNQPSGRTVISYIQQESTGFLYNRNTASFDEVVLADLDMAERAPYRSSLTESPTNTYRLIVDVSLWADDNYKISIREVVNLVEYPDLLSEVIPVAAGSAVDTTLDFKIVTAEARTLFCYNRSVSSGMYLNISTGEMSRVDLVTATIAIRSEYRIPYVEEAPGSYVSTVPSEIPDGTYSLETFELVNDVEIEAGFPQIYRVLDGKRVTALLEDKISLSHNTGGIDALRYVTSNNVPVASASITVYLTSDYSQSIFTNPIGTTTTGDDGRWTVPVTVDSAAVGAYTLVFQKQGHFGPDAQEV